MDNEQEHKQWGERLKADLHDPQKRAEFAVWLLDNSIAVFSPEMGVMLLRMHEQLHDAKDKCPPHLEPLRRMYANALRLVAEVARDEQGAVIVTLQQAINETKR